MLNITKQLYLRYKITNNVIDILAGMSSHSQNTSLSLDSVQSTV